MNCVFTFPNLSHFLNFWDSLAGHGVSTSRMERELLYYFPHVEGTVPCSHSISSPITIMSRGGWIKWHAMGITQMNWILYFHTDCGWDPKAIPLCSSNQRLGIGAAFHLTSGSQAAIKEGLDPHISVWSGFLGKHYWQRGLKVSEY